MPNENEDFIRVDYLVANSLDFTPPRRFYFRNSLDEYVFIKTRSRAKAQKMVDDYYGKRLYRVACSRLWGQ